MEMGMEAPEYYIIPENQFDFKNGISLVEMEFPVYFNFFLKKKKTTLICDEQTQKTILVIFQETLLGPVDYSDFSQDFINGYAAIPDMKRETEHFAFSPFDSSHKMTLDDFLTFLIFDKNNEVTISSKDKENLRDQREVKVQKKSSGFVFYQDNQFLVQIPKKLKIHKRNYHIYRSLIRTKDFKFEPPQFGVTVIGASHGFDCRESTSGFIIWIDQKGIMVDPPPFSSNALRIEGIPPSFIEKVILTHCHADHDAGTFHKLIESSPVEFLTTKTIMSSFLLKYSAQTQISQEELKNLFQFREVKIGHQYNILEATFKFSYSFHSIPCLSLEVDYLGKKFFLSGDTFFNPPKLKELFNQGLFNEERYRELAERNLSQYDLIFHEAGIPPIHTPTSVLQELNPEIKKNLHLYHIALKDVPPDFSGLQRV